MEENGQGSNNIRTNNRQVFKGGALFGLICTLFIYLGAICSVMENTRSIIDYDTGGALNDYRKFIPIYLILCGFFVYGVLIIQGVIFVIFEYLSSRNVEISHTYKWVFYSVEMLIVIIVIFIIFSGIYVDWLA